MASGGLLAEYDRGCRRLAREAERKILAVLSKFLLHICCRVGILVYFIEDFEGTVIGFRSVFIKLTPKEPLRFIFFQLQQTVAVFTQLWRSASGQRAPDSGVA